MVPHSIPRRAQLLAISLTIATGLSFLPGPLGAQWAPIRKYEITRGPRAEPCCAPKQEFNVILNPEINNSLREERYFRGSPQSKWPGVLEDVTRSQTPKDVFEEYNRGAPVSKQPVIR